jgi:hypothetical protein
VLNLVSHFEGGTWIEVFENRVLRIFGPKREGDRSWRKLHSDELHSLYSSLNIVRVIKARRIEVGGTCGTHGGGERCLQGFGWEDLGVGGRITLSCTLGR